MVAWDAVPGTISGALGVCVWRVWDVVTQQIMPGMHQLEHQWVASSRDGEFFSLWFRKNLQAHWDISTQRSKEILCARFWRVWLARRYWFDEVADRPHDKPWNQSFYAACVFSKAIPGSGLSTTFLCAWKSAAV